MINYYGWWYLELKNFQIDVSWDEELYLVEQIYGATDTPLK